METSPYPMDSIALPKLVYSLCPGTQENQYTVAKPTDPGQIVMHQLIYFWKHDSTGL